MITLFHGTSTAALPGIEEKGLVPQGSRGSDEWAKIYKPELVEHAVDFDREPSVYLADDPWNAAQFAFYAAEVTGSNPALLKVMLPDSAKSKLIKDEMFSANSTGAYRFAGVITRKHIKEIAKL